MTKLAAILEDQYATAKRQAGQTIVRKLPGGLRITMTSVLNDVVLQLTREREYPSAREWETVVKYLPFIAEKIEPRRVEQMDRFILTATLKIPQIHQAKFI